MSKTAYYTVIVLFVCSVLVTLIFLSPLRHLETLILDQYFRFKKTDVAHPDIMIVSVDSASISALGDMPWTPDIHIGLLEKLTAGNPKVIAYFLPLSNEICLQIAQRLMGSASEQLRQKLLLPDFLLVDPYDTTKTQIIRTSEKLTELAAGSGVVHLETETDGVCRSKALAYRVAGEILPSLELEILDQYWGVGKSSTDTFHRNAIDLVTRQIRMDPDYRIRVNYVGTARTFPYIPAYKILNGEIKPQIFQDKIILIGAVSPILERGIVTPTTDDLWMPEVEIHASVIHTILSNRFITRVPNTLLFLLTILFGIAMGAVYWFLKPRQGLFMLITLFPAIVFLAFWLFTWKGLWLYILPFLFLVVFAYVHVLGVRLIEMNNVAEQCILRLSGRSQVLYQRHSVAESQISFWEHTARSSSNFLNLDSVFFLERKGKSQTLNMVYSQPDNAWQSVKQSEHRLDTPPYDYALKDNKPVIVQDFMQDPAMDTLLSPLTSSDEVIGYWVLNKTNGKSYFEQRQESIIHLTRQISLELAKFQITQELEEKARSFTKRLASVFWRDFRIARIQSLVQSTFEEHARVAAALNGIADGVILYDIFGRLILYNDKAREITREVIDNLADKDLHELILQLVIASEGGKEIDSLRDGILRQIQNVIVRGQAASFLITVGEHPMKYYQLTLTVIEELGDISLRHSIGIACAFSDISIYEQIVDFKQILQTTSERGRNHLTSIIGYIPLIAEIGDVSDQQKKLLDIIRRNADAITQIFDEFREKLSVEPGIHNFSEIPDVLESRVPVDMTEIAKEAIAKQQRDGEVKIILTQPSPLIEKVWGNRALLNDAMTGIISILKQHLPEDGSINITIEWERSNRIRVDISDQGYGVPQEAVRYALEQLRLGPQPVEGQKWQSYSPESKTIELSLPQIRYIIEVLHNGEITGKSHVGGGMIFTFRIRTVI